MIALLLLMQVAASAPTFEGRLVDGRAVTGTLAEWTNLQITLHSESGQESIDVDQFVTLQTANTTTATQPRTVIASQIMCELVGGTRLVAEAVTGTTDEITLQSPSGHDIEIPANELKYIRFRKPSEALENQWNDLVSGKFSADVLVIRRGETSLDYLEGVIHGMTNEQVSFEFDDERIDVHRSKLEGCLFFSNTNQDFPPANLTVTTWNGDRIRASSIALADQHWLITTREDLNVNIPSAAIQQVKFRSNRVTYLSDMSPVSTELTPAIGRATGDRDYLKLIYAPRVDRGFTGPLTLRSFTDNREQTYAKGIAVHSRTRQTYRLSGGTARLKGIVGLDPEPGSGGAARLEISVDDRIAVDQLIFHRADPIPVDIDLTGATRLDILVDYGEDGDLGDRVNLCDFRIIK